MRTRAERRHNSIKKAIRKKLIANQIYYSMNGIEYYDNLHQYSKNKIHYTFPCKAVYSDKISDIRKIQRLMCQLDELY